MSDKDDTVTTYEADLLVGKLEIDPEVQRAFLKEGKVQMIISHFDPKALGRILVSERVPGDHSLRVLDGWHRLEAVRRLTDGLGTIPAEVYRGMTRDEEARLFLLRNSGDKPTTIDRYKVSIVAGDPESVEIDKLLHSYGWKVTSFTNANGNIAAVTALQKLWRHSVKIAAEPNLVQLALIAIQRAWGNDHNAGQGHILTGIGRVLGEYQGQVDLDRFIDRLRNYKGGPLGLSTTARQYAQMKRLKLPMAVAALLVDEYNHGRGQKARLHPWNKRS